MTARGWITPRVPPAPGLSALLTGLTRGAGMVGGKIAHVAGLNGRSVWSGPDRHHIEVRGVARPDGSRLARTVEQALERLPGVVWARVNGPSGRVVVQVTDPKPRLRDLVAIVAGLERTDGLAPGEEGLPPHPPEEGPRTRRAVSAITADVLGLGLAAVTRVLPFTPVPGEVAGLVGVVDLHPRLHELAGRRLRPDRANSVFPVAGALAQGLAGGWAGSVLDATQRALQWAEARAQLAAWSAAEPDLAATAEHAAAGPCEFDRPRPKPDGPVERYATRVIGAGALAGLVAWPFAGPRRAAALALSALPRSGAAGRETFAAHLGRILARRGVIAMDRGVLRELDRIDTLVLDAAVLRSDRGHLADLVPVGGADPGTVTVRAFELFDPDQPTAVRRAHGWRLGPVDDGPVDGVPADATEARRLAEGGGTVLGLTEDGTLRAVLRVDPEPSPGVDTLPAAARAAGLRLLVAGDDDSGIGDDVVPGGPRLVDSVRAAQADGAMVMLVSADRRALGAADCGLGVWQAGEAPPWGAHLLVGSNLAAAALIVEATGLARAVDRQNLVLAGVGSGVGAFAALTASRSRLPRAVFDAVNGAAAVAMANGVWRAHRLPDRPASTSRPAPPWHLMPVDLVLDRLDSDRAGLRTDQLRERSAGHRTGPEALTLPRAFAEELANPLTPVLAGGAALSAAVGSPVDAGLVGGVVGLSALVGAVQRIRTERSLAHLLSRSAVTATVRRDGTEQQVPADELVPGDVVLVGPSDSVPADCRVLTADGLEADESSLTGESLPVVKTSDPVVAAVVADRRSMLYEGTTVAAGRATAVVVATGADTEVGRGMAMAGQAAPASGVESRLTGLTRTAIPLAIGSAVSVAGAGLLRGVPLAESAATASNLAVASVPEGLPFLVSAAQLAAARRLADLGALVRNPRTIEALGRVDVLCFDKTGTLTEGRLQLAGIGDGDRYADLRSLDDPLRAVLAAGLRATPHVDDPEEIPRQTDRAVLVGAGTAGVSTEVGWPDWRRAAELPFEPSRGYHATVGRAGGAFLLSVKGAPEKVLPRCAHRRAGGGEQPLDEASRRGLRDALEELAGTGHRILAVAERVVPTDSHTPDQVADADVHDLTFVGFLTIADGIRDSAAPAVARIRSAGVHTVMVTGDHPATAAAIAAEISRDGDGQRVVNAADLDRLDDETLGERLMHTDVVARCTPTHKVRLIQALQRCGRTVAMTGDGANDAPAIRLADVGIALGQRGTPAAKAAADLVVTDDRLETIIATLVEGRAMWSSVRHALSILVGGNLGEIAFSVLTAAVTGRSALNGRQLLLVNLLTDLAPAMAIASRPPAGDAADDLLAEGPDTSLGTSLTREMSLRATTTTLGATTGWLLARFTGRPQRAGTVALASLVGTQLGQTLLAGGTSPTALAASAGSAAVLVAVIQTPGLSHFFGCTPLGPVGWSIAAGSALGATLTNPLVSRLATALPGLPAVDGAGPAPQREQRPEPSGPARPEPTRRAAPRRAATGRARRTAD